ncbi:hypothetical protein [Xylophilus sp. GOD-11R]|uniref:hypothetical protein n=1 Tax=Xylophilus sp. GOD-11R TaxID=3089814 RepID=UPI00298C0715|nr:hypothetical protein [Xylophilus sp. GOD-11R]WPB55379.1 hypothetical protein R9X41_14650 [Xylophilus sp. GOD-11R]
MSNLQQQSSQPSSQPTSQRYLKATILTSLAICLMPLSLSASIYHEINSPNWDPNGDSGAIQGFAACFIAAVFGVLYAAIAFPVLASRLHRRHELRACAFISTLADWLFIASFIAATGICFYAGDGWILCVPIALGLFAIAAAVCLPFAPLWMWLAK